MILFSCRASCRSKIPKRDNVFFVDTKEEAVKAGFRPCKSCRNDLITYKPIKEVADEFRRLTDAHWSNPLDLQNKIRSFGYSEHRLSEIFKEELGLTPTEYISNKKIEYAKDKLANSNMRIIDIAFDLNFSAMSSFYKFFKKKTGMAPGEYRKRGDDE